MKKFNPLILFFLFAMSMSVAAQDIPCYADFHINSSIIPFNSKPGKYNLWEEVDNECGRTRSESFLKNYGKNIIRQSQSHFEALASGNVRIAGLSISPIETQALFSRNIDENNKRENISCLTGINATELFLRQRDRNYFADLVENIHFVQRYQNQIQNVNGFKFSYSILEDSEDVDKVLNDPNKIGLVLMVDGAHALGHSLYIGAGITNIKEYEDLVLTNVDRLKGSRVLVKNTEEYLDDPIFSIALCNKFKNGISGKTKSFTKLDQFLFGKEEETNTGLTELGKKVVKRLLGTDNGRRILVDMSHMSVESRKWYYKYIARMGMLGDNVPVLVSHCGISGLSWDEPRYADNDDFNKDDNSYLSHWKQNLAIEDIVAVVNSNGLLGISLDPNVIAGGRSLKEVESSMEGTLQRREAWIRILMANILTVVKTANSVKGWDVITIGSDFDAMQTGIANYMSAEQFPDLAGDIEKFLDTPSDIVDLFTEKDIRTLMYGMSAKEITNKIMHGNAVRFLKENLGVGTVDRLPPPSLKGNVTFKLKEYGGAKVVALAGDFNNWSPNATIFGKEDGKWVCRVDLPPGKHEYRFVVDGRWMPDPANPNKVDDGNGNLNSLIIVRK